MGSAGCEIQGEGLDRWGISPNGAPDHFKQAPSPTYHALCPTLVQPSPPQSLMKAECAAHRTPAAAQEGAPLHTASQQQQKGGGFLEAPLQHGEGHMKCAQGLAKTIDIPFFARPTAAHRH